jgi:hypothetical protein
LAWPLCWPVNPSGKGYSGFREVRPSIAGHVMIGTALMLFLGLPSMA